MSHITSPNLFLTFFIPRQTLSEFGYHYQHLCRFNGDLFKTFDLSYTFHPLWQFVQKLYYCDNFIQNILK